MPSFKKEYILLFLLIYCFMLGMFYFTSVGTETYRLLLNMRRYFPVALGMTLAVFMWRRLGLTLKGILSYGLVTLVWMTVHNVLSYVAYHATEVNNNNYMDVAFGGYIFIITMGVTNFIAYKWKKIPSIYTMILSLAQFLLLLLPFTEIAYFINYGTVISNAAAIALLQTNPGEMKEYLIQNIGWGGIVAIGIGAVLVLTALYVLNKRTHGMTFSKDVESIGRDKTEMDHRDKGHISTHSVSKTVLILNVLFLLGALVYIPKSLPDTGVMHSMMEAKNYLANAKKFEVYHDENLAKLQVSTGNKQFSKPSTIILVIGESAGRNFMSVYGYVGNDTTPWLREMVTNDGNNFLKFNHAYSSYGSTIQALEQALTEKNQYNDKEFSQAFTIIDLAKKAGYKTYWFSNQSVKNTTDTPIQLVARTADVHHWIEDEPVGKERILYDGDLLPMLERVNPNENNFIVLHVMGSHELTLHRFPPEFTRFSEPGVFDLVSNYEDSMAYDDWFLQQVFEYAESHLNLQAMMFFSDHGANPYRKRVADNVPFINFRIPLIIYLSDEYQSLYPDTTAALKSHENQYFTNDLMYELVGGVLNIKSNHLDETSNFASPSYKFTRDTLKTDLGRKSLTEDVSEDTIEK